jgi:peptidoglycan/xylan/chitin deacetylase (PgdA/CDA1 family)
MIGKGERKALARHDRDYGRSGGDMTPPRGMTQLAKRFLLRGIHDRLMPSVYSRATRGIKCINFHYLFDNEVDRAHELFRIIKTFGEFISTTEMLDIVGRTRPASGRFFHLSIDDGFQNIVSNAHPIFRALDIPYAFFICPAYAKADRESEIGLMQNAEYARPLPLANWEMLRALAVDGVEIGSHTRTHRRLSRVADSNDLRHELAGAKREIEEALGRPCVSLAWPFARHDAVDGRTKSIAAEAGYRAIFGEVRGRTVYPGEPLCWYFPRTHFEPAWSKRTIIYYLTRAD